VSTIQGWSIEAAINASGPVIGSSFRDLFNPSGRKRAQASKILYTSSEPRAIDTQAPTSVRMTIVADSAPTRLEVVRPDGSVIPVSAQDSTTYVATFSAEQALAGYKSGDDHNFVGYLDVYDGSTRVFRGNLFVNVRDQTMPDVAITRNAADVQSSLHVVNIRQDAVGPTAPVPVEAIKTFYRSFADVFDFLAVVHAVSYFDNETFTPVRNDTRGLGLSLFDQSAVYGSAGRLQGIINLPIDSFFDLAEKGALHEIGHRFAKYLQLPALTPGGPHWPISDLAYGIMGFSIPPSGEGGDFPFELISQPGGDYLVHQTTVATAYNDLELYLMGLIPPDAVGSHFVFDNQDQNSQLRDGGVLRGPVTRVTVADVIARDGARSPGVADAQKSFRVGTLVLSAGRLLTASEMAFFDYMAARGEAMSPLTYTSGLARGTTLPFYLATGKRASLTTRMVGGPSVALTVSTGGSGAGSVTSSPGGISCGSICLAPFEVGSKVTLTAAATSTSTFAGWSGACSGTVVTCNVALDGAKSVQATFAKPSVTLTVRTVGSGAGSVTSTPTGITCGSVCSAPFEAGSKVALIATATPTSRFAGWSGDCSGKVVACDLALDGPKSVQATFVKTTARIAVSVAGKGRVLSLPRGIACPSLCAASYRVGSQVVLRATASKGWRFVRWQGACKGVGTCTLHVVANAVVRATFRRA